MVEMAETWANVPGQRECVKNIVHRVPRQNNKYKIEPTNNADNPFTLEFDFKQSDCHHATQVDRMEHVIAKISLSFPRRGSLEMYLFSPNGTKSMILGRRQHDSSPKGFSNFNFLTVHFWDEQPFGKWSLQIVNTGNHNNGAKGTSLNYNFTHLFNLHQEGVKLGKDGGMIDSKKVLLKRVILKGVILKTLGVSAPTFVGRVGHAHI